jgi:hypothetical protein
MSERATALIVGLSMAGLYFLFLALAAAST